MAAGRRAAALLVCTAFATAALGAVGVPLGWWSAVWDTLHADGRVSEGIVSPADGDGDGIDDYADLVAGARADALARPVYDSGYYEGGYPPEGRGACTDLVWRAFAHAGYDLKAMVDADVRARPERYPAIETPDPNIDFRRVSTLEAFLSAHAQSLTTSLDDADAWQPGDIVTFGTDTHIGICSDVRDARGVPLLLHNSGQARREEDYLGRPFSLAVSGHFRFDAAQVDPDVIRSWQGV